MGVTAEGGSKLEVSVEESVRELMIDALDVLAAVTEESLARAEGSEREPVRLRSLQVGELRHRVADARGSVRISGREDLLVDVVRATASQAAYELDALLEAVAGARAPLTRQEAAELRAKATAVAGAIDALIACEDDREAT